MTLASLGVTPGHVAAFGWIAAAWLLIILALVGVLLARWYGRDHEQAEATKAMEKRLKPVTDHSHEQDAIL